MPRKKVKKRFRPELVSQAFSDLQRASRFYSAEWLLNDGQVSMGALADLAKAAKVYARSLEKK